MSNAHADREGAEGSSVAVGDRLAVFFMKAGTKRLIRFPDKGQEDPPLERLLAGTVLIVLYMPEKFRIYQRLPESVHATLSMRPAGDGEDDGQAEVTFLERSDPKLGPLTLPVRMLNTDMVFDVVYVPGESTGGARDLIAQINEIKK